MKKSLFTFIFIFLFLFLAAQVKAKAYISIQEKILTSQNQVTLGDVFLGLDKFSDIVIASAPAPGHKKILDLNFILSMAEIYDIKLSNKPLFDRIIIERSSIKITDSEIIELLEKKLANNILGQSEIILDVNGFEFHVDSKSLSPLVIHDIRYYSSNNRFVALLGLGLDSYNKQYYKVSGKIEERIEVFVPKRPIAKGTMISKFDLELKKIAVSKTLSNVISRIEDIDGLIARRSLRTGRMIRTQDITYPNLVKKGENIMITYQTGSLQLSLKAVALQDGVKNQLIRIRNLQSRKTLFAQVTQLGRAVIKY